MTRDLQLEVLFGIAQRLADSSEQDVELIGEERNLMLSQDGMRWLQQTDWVPAVRVRVSPYGMKLLPHELQQKLENKGAA